MSARLPHRPRRQRGAVTAEFALTATLFVAMIVGVVEFSRAMWVYSTAVEATRLGARVAVVCDVGDTIVRQRMRTLLPLLTDANIDVQYPTTECTATDCDPVTVSLRGVTIDLVIPLVPLRVPVPDFSTSLPAESRDSTDNGLCG